MHLEDLKWEIEELTTKMCNINDWIQDNLNTDPNLYEMTECLMEYGNIVSQCKQILFNEAKAKGEEFSEYDVIKLANLYALEREARRMLKLRGLISLDDKDNLDEDIDIREESNGTKYIRSPFFENNESAAHFIKDIHYLAVSGGYVGEDTIGKEGFKKKKEVFTKILGVRLYIWQESQKDLEFLFSNEIEYKIITKGMEELRDILDPYYYEGGEDIDKMIDEIKENSTFKDKEEDNTMHI